MTRTVYLVGPPGVGKSTALARVVELMDLTRGEPRMVGEKLLWAELLWETNYCAGVALGAPHDSFPGTDRLSMQVSPEAVRWISSDRTPPLVFGEGNRLGNSKFMAAAATYTDLLVVHLTADQEDLDARCAGRGSNQTMQFRRTAASAARSAAATAADHGAQVLTLDTSMYSPEGVAEAIYTLI